MSLLPSDFYTGTVSSSSSSSTSTTPDLLVDYVIDLNTGHLVVSDSGQFIICKGLRAVVMQMWRKLHVMKGKYLIFSSTYGNTFSELKGKGKSYADAYTYGKLVSAIVDGTYVTDISNFATSFNGSSYTISFTANTIYGNTSEVLDIELE